MSSSAERAREAGEDPARQDDDAALLSLARAGSMDAAGRLVASWYPRLLPRAVAIAGSRSDGEDLLANAIAGLLGAWRAGAGPHSSVPGYLVRSMTNARIDQSRSPSARVRSLDAVLDAGVPLPEVAVDDAAAQRHVDLGAEFALVRRGFGRLPADYQALLRETVVHGRRPAELVAEFGRTAPAISSMQLRAKRSLRRSVLIEHLGEGGDECRGNAEQLPEVVADDWAGQRAEDRGLAHVRSCPRCRANWSRFGRLSAALGLLPALVIAEPALLPPAPAAADAGGSATDGRQGPRAAVVPGRPSRVLIAALVATAVGAAGLVTAFVLGPADPTRFHVGERGPIPEPMLQRAELSVSPVFAANGDGVLSVAFSVPRASWWRIDAVSIALPAGARIAAAPAGWSCETVSGGAACLVDGDSPRGGVLRIAPAAGATLRGAFAIGIDAATTDEVGIRGDVSGRFG